MHGDEWTHLLATDSLDECRHILASAKTTFRSSTSARSPGYIWRPCKRLEHILIGVPLRDELLEQTRPALILSVSSDAHDWPGFYLQYKIALSTNSH